MNRGLLWEWVTCTQHPMSQVRKLSLREVRDPPKVINRNLGPSHRREGVPSGTLSSELSWFDLASGPSHPPSCQEAACPYLTQALGWTGDPKVTGTTHLLERMAPGQGPQAALLYPAGLP